MSEFKGEIISIEGNIGSGKSTLLENLRIHFQNNSKVLIIKEPIEEWESIKDEDGVNILQKFYKNQEKYAFSFQVLAYISRLVLLKNTMKNNPDSVIIVERSFYTDKYVFGKMLYDDNKIEDVNYQIYTKWLETFSTDCPFSKTIYIKATPETCHSRILQRLRLGEDNIPLNYLENCSNYHDNMISIISETIPRYKCLILDGNTNINYKTEELNNWIIQIELFINS